MTILINNCEESSYSLEALLRNCFYQDASGNIYLGVKLGAVAPDGSPSLLSITITGTTTLTLNWTNGSTNEDGISIERSTDGISFSEIDTVGAGVATYDDTGLTGDTQYWYRVRAFKDGLYSDYSNTDNDTTWAPLLLDTYSNGVAAYGLRKLKVDYLGSAVRIRRDSDNAEQDIGFVAVADVNGDFAIDTSAITAFVGANSAYVVKWYDQSGNSLDLIQSTAFNQMRIVNAGTIETDNSKTAINDTAGWQYYQASDNALLRGAEMSVFTVHNYTAITASQPLIWCGSDPFIQASLNWEILGAGLNVLNALLRTGSAFGGASSGQTIATMIAENTTPNAKLWADNVLRGNSAVNLGTNDTGGLWLSHNNNTFSWRGTIQEVVIFGADKTTDRTSIQDNINTYYGAY